MIIVFDKATQMVTGIDREPNEVEFSLELPGKPLVSKVLQRSLGNKQKTDELKRPLYKKNVVLDDFGREISYETTTESRIPLTTRPVERERFVRDENGIQHREVYIVHEPLTFEDLPPLMEAWTEPYTVTFEANPSLFSYLEVFEAEVEIADEILVGQQLVALTLGNLQANQMIDFLGQAVSELKLEIMNLKNEKG